MGFFARKSSVSSGRRQMISRKKIARLSTSSARTRGWRISNIIARIVLCLGKRRPSAYVSVILRGFLVIILSWRFEWRIHRGDERL